MDGNTASTTSKATPSDDIVVHDFFLKGTVYRTLSLDSASKSLWRTQAITNVHLAIQIREGDLAVVTNNSQLPRLNLDSKWRSNLQLDTKLHLPSCTLPLSSFNCSNVVSTCCINNVYSYFTSRPNNVCITKNDCQHLKSKVNLHLINTTSSNFVTVITSSTLYHQLDRSSRPLLFTSIDNQLPSSLLPHPVIYAITVPPKIWRKNLPLSINPPSTTM